MNLNGSISCVLLQYRATLGRHGGTISHFIMAILICLSIATTALLIILYIIRGYGTGSFGNNINWKHQILNLATSLHLLLVSRPLSILSLVSCTVFLSGNKVLHTWYKLLISSSTVGSAGFVTLKVAVAAKGGLGKKLLRWFTGV